MERCPSCHARWDGGEQCRRCGMALGHLLAAEQVAERLLARAARHLADGHLDAAIEDLSRSRALVEDPLAEHLLTFARDRQRQDRGAHLQALADALGLQALGMSAGPKPDQPNQS